MRWIPLLVAVVLVLLSFLLLSSQPPNPAKPTKDYILLDENLNTIAVLDHLPKEYNGRVLMGTTEKGYVYVPRYTLFEPKFVDRLLLLAGIEENVNIPLEWWMEKNGVVVKPLGRLASNSFTLVVKTPYEVVESNVPVVGLYTGKWYLGKEVKADGNCIWVERWRETNVPVLIQGKAVVDPESFRVCRPDCEQVTVNVKSPEEIPLSGWYTLGRNGKYGYFFGEFNGHFTACKCDDVRVHVSGYRVWAGRVCEDSNVELTPLKGGLKLRDGVHLDIMNALAGIGKVEAEEGVYRNFQRFPLQEEKRSLPAVKVRGWLGYKVVERVPIYSFLLTGEDYVYVHKDGTLNPRGWLICSGEQCFTVSDEGEAVLCFGKERLRWDGRLYGQRCLRVKL